MVFEIYLFEFHNINIDYLYKGVEWQGIKNRNVELVPFSAIIFLKTGITSKGPRWWTTPKYHAGTRFPMRRKVATVQINNLENYFFLQIIVTKEFKFFIK